MSLFPYLSALVLTIGIEVALAKGAMACFPKSFVHPYFLSSVLAVNLLTNASLQVLVLATALGSWLALEILAEIAIVVVEWRILVLIYGKNSKAFFAFAVGANLVSYGIGLLIFPC